MRSLLTVRSPSVLVIVTVALSVWWMAMAAHAQDRGVADIDAYFDAEYSPEYEQRMVERIEMQIGRYFDRYNERVVERRDRYWDRDFSSWEAYAASIAPNREHFAELIGVVGERDPVSMETFGAWDDERAGTVAATDAYVVKRVRWQVYDGIQGEGLLLTPAGDIRARVVALPDADQTPADLAGLTESVGIEPFARRLAENGIEVVVPVLISRESTHSGSSTIIPQAYWVRMRDPIEKYTNEPHREWIYRHAYPMGRHPIGFEVEKVSAVIDWFHARGDQPVGVAGYGEGGLIAFYAAAVDDRIESALVSGYYGPRERLWEEPLYRNVWGLLTAFGDAEIASLVAPRGLVVEYSSVPDVERPPAKGSGRGSDAAAPGRLWTPTFDEVQQEIRRLHGLFPGSALEPDVTFIHSDGATIGPGSEPSLRAFVGRLGISGLAAPLSAPAEESESRRIQARQFDRHAQQERQVTQITEHLVRSMHEMSDYNRYRFLNGDLSSPDAWDASMEPYREIMYEELIGKLDEDVVPPNPRMREVFDEEHWTGYEVVLDVLPGVLGWGLLAVPKDLEEGEKRPVMVVQHGHAGIPTTPLRIDSYNKILPKLAERGFVVFAPHNPYQFNVRKATPLKATVFSVLIPQHQQIVRHLKSLPYVDGDRIGFYGKSWGGRSALRITPYVPEYSFAICSAYFNQWQRKILSTGFHHSILYTGSIGLYEWNQLNTFSHAEMAMLIAPRPFMVENGYFDPIKPDEWAGYEFAKVKRLYQRLGIEDLAVFGTHIGGHEVHADTILPFIHRHLKWPVRATE